MTIRTTKKRLGAGALAGAVLSVTAACGGGGDGEVEKVTADKLPTLSVQATDLPSGYRARTGYPKRSAAASDCLQPATAQGQALATQVQGQGLQACYLSVYTQERGADSNSPGSGVFLFGDEGGAARALPLVRQALTESIRPSGVATLRSTEDIPASGLGQQAAPGVRFTISAGPTRSFRLILYFWRTANMVAYAGGGDSLGDLNETSYLDLAKKVDRRAAE